MGPPKVSLGNNPAFHLILSCGGGGISLPSSLCKLLLTQAWREQNTQLGIYTLLKVHLKRCPCLLLQRGAACASVLLVP